jgi:hypothetical protein
MASRTGAGWASMEVRATVDDLRDRLAEVADLAARQARGPSPAAVAQRARRRRLAGGALALVLVGTVAGTVALSGLVRDGLQPATGGPDRDRRQDLPWRPLEAREWAASVEDQRPLDPVLVAAEGERAGTPWRLVVYRSQHRPVAGPPGRDVCFIVDWISNDPRPQAWQAHGTCAPEAQPATLVTAEGPGARDGQVAAFGRAPDGATRVRLELRGRAAVETATTATPVGRFYLAFVPRAAHLERMVALDDAGRALGTALGQGDLSRRELGYPPTGPVATVASGRSPAGRLELVAWPVRQGFCLQVVGERGGGSSSCGPDALEPQPHCSWSQSAAEPAIRLRLVYGGVDRSARRVEVEADGKRVTVPARDAGRLLDRSFFLASLDPDMSMRSIRVVALDADGTRVAALSLSGCG